MTDQELKNTYPLLFKYYDAFLRGELPLTVALLESYRLGYNNGIGKELNTAGRTKKQGVENAELKEKMTKLEQDNKELMAEYARALSIIKELRGKYGEIFQEAENLKAGVEVHNTSLGMTEGDIDDMKKKVGSLDVENERLKEDNNPLRKSQMLWVDSSGRVIDGLLGQANDKQLVALLAKRGYHGEISRAKRLYDTDMQTRVGEKIETIKIG